MRVLASIVLATNLIAVAYSVRASEFPSKPIRILTTEAGGNTDFTTRIIAQGLAGELGQPAIVDNRVTQIAIQAAANAIPDGYTLLIDSSTLWIESLLRKTSYDPVRDFSPVSLVATSPLILVVNPSLPVTSVAELIALAKVRKGQLNYGSGPTGGPNHLAAELFKSMTGIDVVHVSYKGGGPAANAVVAGEVQVMFPLAATAGPHIRSGRLRGVAVTSLKRSALTPDLSTISETVPGYEFVTLTGVFAPAKTPATIIDRLNRATLRALYAPSVKQTLLNSGIEPIGSTPQGLAASIKSDVARLGKVVNDVGIRIE